MNNPISLIVLISCLLVSAAQGQTILSNKNREIVLEGMKEVVGNVERPALVLEGISNPFLEREEAIPAEVETATGQISETVSAPDQALTDDVALRLISNQFRPLGSLILGTRGILQLANGKTIGQGETIGAEIKGRSYEVIIEEVTGNGFTLRLGSAVLQRSFSATQGNPLP